MILDALSYPFRCNGLLMIFIGAVFSIILHILECAPFGFGLIASIFSMGYFGAFYLDIISSTMTDSDAVPDWPSVTSFWSDILSPIFRICFLILISFAPLIAIVAFADHNAMWFKPSILGGIAYACLYFPMAVLATQAFGNVFAALPHVVIPGIFRALPGYLLSTFALVFGFVLFAIIQGFADDVPYLGRFLTAAISLYGLMFQGRLIGLIYRKKSEKLGWE